MDRTHAELCRALSALLSYPAGDVPALAHQARGLAGPGAAAAALGRFEDAAREAGGEGLEELYTAAFDLRPACAPYLGAQLLAEDSPVRGPLLAKLAEVYATEGYRPREELADHVAEVLGFLAVARPGPVRDDLVRDGLAPALEKMIDAFADRANPYRELLVAVRAIFAAPGAGRPRGAEARP